MDVEILIYIYTLMKVKFEMFNIVIYASKISIPNKNYTISCDALTNGINMYSDVKIYFIEKS